MRKTTDPRKARQSGISLIETVVFTAIGSMVLFATTDTVVSFRRATTANQNQLRASSENRRILSRIAAEVLQTSTQRDLAEPTNLELPMSEYAKDSEVNEAYNYPATPIGVEHATMGRDRFEYWHTPIDERRFYIYKTYDNFDTLEFQKVQWPKNAVMLSKYVVNGQVQLPWSTRRKIFLEDDRVLLRTIQDINNPDDVATTTLGLFVEDLQFHLTQKGHLIIRVTTTCGNSSVTNEVVVAPVNELA